MASGKGTWSRRKQQTRLSFDPVEETASPSAMPQAKVGYEVPGATRRLTHRTSKQNLMIEDTPPPGKQVSVAIDKSPKLKKGRKSMSSQTLPQMLSSQTQGLTAQVEGLDLPDSDNDLETTSSRSRQTAKSSKKGGSRRKSSSSIDLSLVPASASSFMPHTSKQAKLSSYTGDNDVSSSEGSSSEEGEQILSKRSPQIPIIIDDDSDELSLKRGKSKLPKSSASDVKDRVTASPSSQKLKTLSPGKKTSNCSARTVSIPNDEDESEDDIIVLPSARKLPRSTDQIDMVGSDEDDSDDVFGPTRSSQRSRKVVAEDDEDSDNLPLIPSANTPRSSRYQNSKSDRSTKRKRASSTEQSSNDSESYAAPSSKKLRHQPSEDELSSDDSESEVKNELVSSARKLKSKGKGKAKTQDEQEKTRVTRARADKKPKRTSKQKQMELLKRRRAGENIDAVTDSSSEEETRGAIYDTDSDREALTQFYDESQDEAIEPVARSLKPGNKIDYDDSFVVEDDEAPLGVPGFELNDIPLEFTHYAHKRLKDYFRYIVEWMVQNKINPGFERNDPIYRLAFRKVDDEAHGYANSKFSSSSWKTGFTRALWARPTLLEEPIEHDNADEYRKCDACGRSGHPAKFVLQFEGSPYDQNTLEDINDSTDDDSDNDSSLDPASGSGSRTRHQRVERNIDGHKVPPSETIWYVGRFCKANAESAHALVHWRYSLNEWVVSQLDNEGYTTPAALASRAKLSKKKLSKLAVRIVDDWDVRSEVKSLYRTFKDVLGSARGVTQNRWNH